MTSYLYEVQTGNGTLACLSLFLYRVGGGGVRNPTFFGHVKFEVKNFSLYLVLWTVSAGWGGPNFFGHTKFEIKIFSLYLVLWTLFLQVEVGCP